MGKTKRKLRKRTIYLILAVVLAICAIVGGAYWIVHQSRLNSQQEYYEMLQTITIPMEEVEIPVTQSETASEEECSAEPVDLTQYNVPQDKQPNFEELQTINEHIYAWIYLPGTEVDYPIVQHPTELDYYLNHNIDGSEGYPGCIYTQHINSKEFDDFNTVVYGHNMKNGTMFRELHSYEDDTFFEDNPYIYVYTKDGVLVYQVFAAYEFSNIHLLMGFDLTSEDIRRIYLNNIFTAEGKNNNYNMEIPVSTDDNLLTLTTCIANKPDKRYLVAAVLVADGREQ